MKEKSDFIFNGNLIREQNGFEVSLAPDPALFADAFANPGTLRKLSVKMEFSVADEELLLDGEVTAELALVCSRCAVPVIRSFTGPFDEQYAYSVEYIDTRELVREAVSLLEPMKLLCSDSCRGRCANCGTELNDKACACDQEKAPHFDALKDFKVRKKDKES